MDTLGFSIYIVIPSQFCKILILVTIGVEEDLRMYLQKLVTTENVLCYVKNN
jgi:hypothetical protein